MHIPILAAIQFRFLAPVPTAAASEADDAVTRVDIGFPIQLEIEPVTALLQDNIVVSVSGTSGTATRKSSLVSGFNCKLLDQNQMEAKTTRQCLFLPLPNSEKGGGGWRNLTYNGFCHRLQLNESHPHSQFNFKGTMSVSSHFRE